MLSSADGSVPLKLDFDLTSRGYVIGKLVRVTHRLHVTCPVVVDAKKTKPIRFPKKACAVYMAGAELFSVTSERSHSVFLQMILCI
jgi:hypothetical protein